MLREYYMLDLYLEEKHVNVNVQVWTSNRLASSAIYL